MLFFFALLWQKREMMIAKVKSYLGQKKVEQDPSEEDKKLIAIEEGKKVNLDQVMPLAVSRMKCNGLV